MNLSQSYKRAVRSKKKSLFGSFPKKEGQNFRSIQDTDEFNLPAITYKDSLKQLTNY